MRTILFSLLFLYGCKITTIEVKHKVVYPQAERRIVHTVDTLSSNLCRYTTLTFKDSILTGQGSIITRCGCFFPGEEVNMACITSQ